MVNVIHEFDNNVVRYDLTVIDAIKKLDEQSIKVMFITDNDGKLCASLTDGDVRRAILGGIQLDSIVDTISNHNYVSVKEGYEIEEVNELMTAKGITAIPVVDDNGYVKKIIYKQLVKKKALRASAGIPVVIMAGGKGTRLYPYTKILPKPLIPIEDTPICERIIESFIEVGCCEFYMVVNYKKNMIKAYFADAKMKCRLEYIDEEIPLGTGGGIKLLEGKINSSFILTNCDILVLEDANAIYEHHIKESNDVTMVCSLKNFEIPYGTVEFSEGGEIIALNEKPHMSYFTNTGFYVVEPCIMDYINHDENIGMPDIIDRMRKDGKKVGVYPISENAWLDMGQFDSMEGMERRLRQIEGNLDS